jgi:hypothetical protein
VIVLAPSGPPSPPPSTAARGPLLWAGPVLVEPPAAPPARGAARDQSARLVLLAELAARYLDEVRESPW